MYLCSICGAVDPRETIQCPRVKTAPVCMEFCRKCEHYKFSPFTPGICGYHLSEEYKEKEQKETDAYYLNKMNKKAEEWRKQC